MVLDLRPPQLGAPGAARRSAQVLHFRVYGHACRLPRSFEREVVRKQNEAREGK